MIIGRPVVDESLIPATALSSSAVLFIFGFRTRMLPGGTPLAASTMRLYSSSPVAGSCNSSIAALGRIGRVRHTDFVKAPRESSAAVTAPPGRQRLRATTARDFPSG